MIADKKERFGAGFHKIFCDAVARLSLLLCYPALGLHQRQIAKR